MKKKRGNKSLLPLPLPPPLIDDLKAEEAAIQPTAYPDPPSRLTMAPQAVETFLSSLKDYYNTDTVSDAVLQSIAGLTAYPTGDSISNLRLRISVGGVLHGHLDTTNVMAAYEGFISSLDGVND
ncbi:hypothetical protein MRS44_015907 [Fusarium solani]|uniref:uncharacterized protein n=1 Tax=Fusarium solani TaxID=169388 RepID=UPI0032C4A649|nr:hypothetical protein MRS44_015907 [Fusarium solani]